MPQEPSELNKKPPAGNQQEVNNNYNKSKFQVSDKSFRFIVKTVEVVGKHTQTTNGKNIT